MLFKRRVWGFGFVIRGPGHLAGGFRQSLGLGSDSQRPKKVPIHIEPFAPDGMMLKYEKVPRSSPTELLVDGRQYRGFWKRL